MKLFLEFWTEATDEILSPKNREQRASSATDATRKHFSRTNVAHLCQPRHASSTLTHE